MKRPSIGFITHRTLESLLGGSPSAAQQQRRRLVERGWLPKAPMLRADRLQLSIYPEFELAALAVRGSVPELAAGETLVAAAARAQHLYNTQAAADLQTAVVEALRESGDYGLDQLVTLVAEHHSDALDAWRQEVERAEDDLQELALIVEAASGRIVETSATRGGQQYTVEIDDGETVVEKHTAGEAPLPMKAGATVLRDRVRLGSFRRDFLLPLPRVALQGATPVDPEEEYFRSLFEGMEGQIRVVPHLGAGRQPVDEVPSDELDVEVPWELLAGSNTMSRERR